MRCSWCFASLQERAGFDRRYNFHSMRLSSMMNIYRASKNLFLAQRFARHASPLTTIIYTHPADEGLWEESGTCRAGESMRGETSITASESVLSTSATHPFDREPYDVNGRMDRDGREEPAMPHDPACDDP